VRSEQTIVRATGTDPANAAAVLDSVGGSVKAAILVIMTGLAPEQAFDLLRHHGGDLGRAVSPS
jgi:N-acetylmuramic acid 6-phosphate etherase